MENVYLLKESSVLNDENGSNNENENVKEKKTRQSSGTGIFYLIKMFSAVQSETFWSRKIIHLDFDLKKSKSLKKSFLIKKVVFGFLLIKIFVCFFYCFSFLLIVQIKSQRLNFKVTALFFWRKKNWMKKINKA